MFEVRGCGGEGLVAEHLFDYAEVFRGFVERHRERAAQIVQPELSVHSGFSFERRPRIAQRLLP